MANLIEATEIAGAKVYGVAQMSYSVDGVSGKDYMAALTAASFKHSVAIEKAVSGYAEVVRQRERKLEDLGGVIAALNQGYATLKIKDQEPSDKTDYTTMLYDAYFTASKYGVSISWSAFSGKTMQMRRDQVLKAQNNVQYAIDKEDNDLKQDMVTLQSLLTKRDNAFSTAAKLTKKAGNAASSIISSMGV
jgi:hypothetical protein